MAVLRPFRGLRYRLSSAEAGRAIAPPYDVISARQQEALYDQSPYNVIRVEYGREPGEERYRAAAEALRRWREEGVLAPEERPALYRYEQEFTHGGRSYRRTAVIGRVRLEPLESGVILPHEYTMARPKADRMALLTATRANTSPVLSLVADEDGRFAAALSRVTGPPVVDAEDFVGQRHRLTVIDDERTIAALTEAVSGRSLYIADGHHRYETALTYQADRREASPSWTGDEPENFVLMAIAATNDLGLLILPIHRLVRPARTPADAVTALQATFDIEDVGALDDAGARAKLVHSLSHAGERTNAFGVAGLAAGRLHLLTLRDQGAVEALMPAGHPPAWRALDVNVLQYGILQPVFGIDAAALASGDYVEFSEEHEEALEAVRSGRVPLAIIVNPVRPEHIIGVAGAGDRMPQKSTFFYPKLGTGLVINSHELA